MSETKKPEFVKGIGLFSAIMIVVGSIIGGGIFLTPSSVITQVNDEGIAMLAWAIGGLVAITGALTYAELSSLLPKAGGQYAYLKSAYGGLFSFLYVWVQMLIVIPGTIAALVAAFSTYAGYFLDLTHFQSQLLAGAMVILLTAVNCFGVKSGSFVLSTFTVVKILVIVAIVILGFSLGTTKPSLTALDTSKLSSTTLAAAMIGVMFSYGGWQHLTFPSEEIKNPSRTLPLAIVTGTGFVLVAYLIINYAFMNILPMEQMIDNKTLAASAMELLLGKPGGIFISAAIMMSTLGTASVYTLTAPRMYYALARDGEFFKPFALLHKKYNTPYVSIIFQGALTLCFVFASGIFFQLIEFTTVPDWIFYSATGLAVIVLRFKNKEPRQYKVPLYPIVPIIFIGSALLLVIYTFINNPFKGLLGFGILALGIPVFYWFKRKKS